jgi:signal transduction histidine kinase
VASSILEAKKMRPHGKLVRARRHLPSGSSVRLRLTALYGSLFLISGAVLLTITYLLVKNVTSSGHIFSSPNLNPQTPSRGHFPTAASQHSVDLHQLLIQSGIALAIMTLISAALGWIVAGRVLAPLRTITATTRRISEENLHDRLALAGPRDELTALADTIDGLLARLEAAFDGQRLFVANASHELRTPLALMRTTLDVAVAKPGGVPPQLHALDAELRDGLDHADRLLDSFLVLARAQHGTLTDQSSVAVERIITAALATRGGAIAEKQIQVQTALAPIRVTGSELLLTRMIENVIENAVGHNQRDGFVHIACEIDGDVARLVVESGGPVLDQHSVTQLAQPFRRLGAERTRSQNGFGLGLSIVAAVAAAHGGSLELHARSQGGLRVQITLPAGTLPQPAGAPG